MRSDGVRPTREVPENEMAEWAKLTAEKSDTRGVEPHTVPLLVSLEHFMQEILEKKWANIKQWAGDRTSRKKYKTPSKQKPDGTPAGSSKRLTSSCSI